MEDLKLLYCIKYTVVPFANNENRPTWLTIIMVWGDFDTYHKTTLN